MLLSWEGTAITVSFAHFLKIPVLESEHRCLLGAGPSCRRRPPAQGRGQQHALEAGAGALQRPSQSEELLLYTLFRKKLQSPLLSSAEGQVAVNF